MARKKWSDVEILYEGSPMPSLKMRVWQLIGRVLSGKKRVDGQLQYIVGAINSAEKR